MSQSLHSRAKGYPVHFIRQFVGPEPDWKRWSHLFRARKLVTTLTELSHLTMHKTTQWVENQAKKAVRNKFTLRRFSRDDIISNALVQMRYEL